VSNLALVGMVVVFALNYALMRIPGWERRGFPYWFVQATNAAAAAWLVVVGIPDLPRIPNVFVALLFVYHGIQNELRARTTNMPTEEERQEARRKAYEAAIEAGRAEAREEMNRP
jgi:uncharacterized membrane protein